jgi:acetylornithine/succinyldiaminopimelate/putrescine aminotransferase
VIDHCLAVTPQDPTGLMTDWFLFAPNCLRIAPPLIISEAQIKLACERILKAIDQSKL